MGRKEKLFFCMVMVPVVSDRWGVGGGWGGGEGKEGGGGEVNDSLAHG